MDLIKRKTEGKNGKKEERVQAGVKLDISLRFRLRLNIPKLLKKDLKR